MNIEIPELSLVVLIGASGSGKTTFAGKHFKKTEIISSDDCRAMVADDPADQNATPEAFEVMHFIAGTRLRTGRLTVADATNVQSRARKPLVELARKHDCLPVAIVLNMPEPLCQSRNIERTDRQTPARTVRRQTQDLRRSIRGLKREGFSQVHVINSPEDADDAVISRAPLWSDLKQESGPFDVIGDVHGCFDELVELLQSMEYEVGTGAGDDGETAFSVTHPQGRKAVFVGDLVDRGPSTPQVLRLVMDMVKDGAALCVAGNHESKLLRKLQGRNVQVSHGLAETLEQLEQESPAFRERTMTFLDGLISHYILDGGNLAVAHAGIKQEYQGRASRRVRDFCLYGETTGESDEYGLPIRGDWAAAYRGKATVVYGHTPVDEPGWTNNTINVDTGCVFGGRLTALRYPERKLVSVPAGRVHYEYAKPISTAPAADRPAQARPGRPTHLLDITDVTGRRAVTTRLAGNVTLREENAAAALETMSRFTVDPRWLVYLPPTMSPCGASGRPGLLEHPAEAFAHYRNSGIAKVICEEKHMGSRAIVIVGQDPAAIEKTFGMTNGETGVCYTRTGRRFFNSPAVEAEFLDRVKAAATAAGLWEELKTGWLALDCEMMPWSLKAQELIKEHYAPVGAAAKSSLTAAQALLQQAQNRGIDTGEKVQEITDRLRMANLFTDSYARYCWPSEALEGVKLAPFHLMASQGQVHAERDHLWHMDVADRLTEADPALFQPTNRQVVELGTGDEEQATAWWERLTAQGGEGMVVKPLDFTARGNRGPVQPAVKCRGSEYLRIIYGPEYTLPENLERLRHRGLHTKRSMAMREFALGLEGLQRFVEEEPLYRVHECAFAVLALESEPVDPRL